MDGDHKQDIVWQNQRTGQVFIQLMDGKTIKAGGVVTTVPAPWRLIAAQDIDGDGKADLVWWHSTAGGTYAHRLDGLTVKSEGYGVTQALAWTPVAAGDATGDKQADLLWRHGTTGQVKLQTDFQADGTVIYTEPNTSWQILAMPDLNGDGKADVLWKNTSTGTVFGQLLNGTTITQGGVIYTEPNPAWQLVHTADFNGDGNSDLLWRNTTTGQVFMQQMNGLTIAASQFIYTEPDAQWKIVPAQESLGGGSGSMAAQGMAPTTGKATKPRKRPSAPGGGASGPVLKALSVNTTVVYYIHPDHLGTPRAITRPSDNKVVWKWDNTEPFGNNLPNENPSGLGIFKNNNRRLGEYYDEETGKIWNGFRVLDPDGGRYLQSDPIGLRGGINTYAHVLNNPLLYLDPFGLRPPGEMEMAGNPGGIGGANIIRGNGFGYPSPGAAAAAGAAAAGAGALQQSMPKPNDSRMPGAANDEKFDDKECPPDCEAMRRLLNKMYHTIQAYSSTHPMDVGTIAGMWLMFEFQVKKFEKMCGKYTPPPSFDDIYRK